MAIAYYIIPYGKFSASRPNANVPKYISNTLAPPEIQTNRYSLVNMGVEGVCLAAVDADAPALAALDAKPDVIGIVTRANSGNTLSAAQATNAAGYLEAIKIPGDWVVEGMTWRVVLRNVARIFLFYQYMHSSGLYEQVLTDPLTLDSKFNELSANAQARLTSAAAAHGYGSIPPGTSMRVVLRRLFQEWTGGAIKMAGEEVG